MHDRTEHIAQLQREIHLGNQRAFEDLYRYVFPNLLSFAYSFVLSREAAEELVNDVMVKIWEKRSDLLFIENLRSYLFTAVKNSCLNYLQSFSKIQVALQPESEQPWQTNFITPEKQMEWKELYQQLQLAVEALPQQCKAVFRLVKEEGMSYKEVSEILSISPRTVETQLVRAFQKLLTNKALQEMQSKKKRRTTLGRFSVWLVWVLWLAYLIG